MSARDRSMAVHVLAGLAVVCATVLGALRVLDAAAVVAVYGMALGGVGLYHVPAPGQAQTGSTEVT